MNIVIFLRNKIRYVVLNIKKLQYTYLLGMHIHPSARISYGARLDKTNPKGIHIGEESYVATGAIIFTHDFSRAIHRNTYIGNRCFIGSNAIIMCGIKIGNQCVIGSGAVVTKDVPSNCIVAGNPARIIREGIKTGTFGQLIHEK